MGVLTFRTPIEGLEQFQKANDLISLIQEIVKNPSVTKTISDLSQQLSNAQELSDAKKKQAIDAEEIIAQSKEALEELEKEKKDHDEYIRTSLIDLQKQKDSHIANVASWMNEKLSLQRNTDRIKSEADEKLNKAKELNDLANRRHSEADKRESDFEQRVRLYEEEVKKRDDQYNANLASLAVSQQFYEKNVQNLQKETELLEARKKKLSEI